MGEPLCGPLAPLDSATMHACGLLSMWKVGHDPRIDWSRRFNTFLNTGRIEKTYMLASLWATHFLDIWLLSILQPCMPVACYRCGKSSMTPGSIGPGGSTHFSILVESRKLTCWPHYGRTTFWTFGSSRFCNHACLWPAIDVESRA